MIALDDWVAYQDDELGRQIGQVVRIVNIRAVPGVYCVMGKTRGGRPGETCVQIRWRASYPPMLPGSVNVKQLKKLTPLEMLAIAAC